MLLKLRTFLDIYLKVKYVFGVLKHSINLSKIVLGILDLIILAFFVFKIAYYLQV